MLWLAFLTGFASGLAIGLVGAVWAFLSLRLSADDRR